MYSLLYASMATLDFTSGALLHLLNQARRNNSKAGITGMLLFHEGNFMQLLEGDPEALRSLHRRLADDPRHHKMVVLSEGPTEERQFPDWSMGFQKLDDFTEPVTDGVFTFEELSLDPAAFAGRSSRALRLLRLFAEA